VAQASGLRTLTAASTFRVRAKLALALPKAWRHTRTRGAWRSTSA